jgi:tyrosyl-tRNA synthetase
MYGKVMSVPDAAMMTYYRLLTRLAPAQIAEIEQTLQSGALHPRDAKMKLAREIVEIYHNPDDAAAAEEHFKRVFQREELPEDIPVLPVRGEPHLADLLAENGLAKSRNEAKRLIEQGGVRLNGVTMKDPGAAVSVEGEPVLQVGKRKFVRLTKTG